MDLSVVVTTWNRKSFLGDALESIEKQDFQGRTQVIVCDDGSEDGSEEVIEAYRDKFAGYEVIREWPSYEDRLETSRLAMNINKALKLCDGRYISYLPDDDLYMPERNRMMVEFLDEHPETYLAYHWIKMILVSLDKAVVGQAVDLCDPWDEANQFWEKYIYNRIDHTAFVHRNLRGDNIPWNEDVRYKRCVDWGFLLRALDRGLEFAHFPNFLAIGRKIQGQSLNLDGNKMIEALKEKKA